MILVDTSIWVDHLRYGDEPLSQLLIQGLVFCHPMIIGELACGNLQNRSELISMWQNLPLPTEASHQEALYLLESRHLMGKGIGYIDLHLLATCLLTTNTLLWTRDKRLASIADSLGIGFSNQ
jgi:predicted nucleic acid-binding protein